MVHESATSVSMMQARDASWATLDLQSLNLQGVPLYVILCKLYKVWHVPLASEYFLTREGGGGEIHTFSPTLKD